MSQTEADLTEARAVRYFDAARTLHRSANAPVQSFWEPLNYLLAMSAELTLKAFLIRSGIGPGALKQPRVRHSLTALLRLAVANGLRSTYEAVEPLLHMDRAHSEHAFRYTDKLSPGQVTVIFHAEPNAAINGLAKLIDHASPNPSKLRGHIGSEMEWPYALPVQAAITSDELELWIAEVTSHQSFVESRAKAGASR